MIPRHGPSSAGSVGEPSSRAPMARRRTGAALRVRLWLAMSVLAVAATAWIPPAKRPPPARPAASIGALATPAPDAAHAAPSPAGRPGPARARTPRRPSAPAATKPNPAPSSALDSRIQRDVPGGGRLKSNQPSKRNNGSAAVLSGRICILHLFLTDPDSSWTPEEIAAARSRVAKAIAFLRAQGKRYHQSFTFVQEDLPGVQVEQSIPTDMFHAPSWIEDAVRKAGRSSAVHVLDAARRRHVAAGGLIMVHVNKRATSYNLTYYQGVSRSFSAERVVMFTRYADGRPTCAASYAHEVLHSFGAGELYFPFDARNGRKQMGRRLFPNDVMCRVDYNINALAIGEYTAYRIGWLDALDTRYRLFQD